MNFRIPHCVECPNCHTRYLVGFSPYGNGSYLMPAAPGSTEEYTLYCSCAKPHAVSRWRASDLEPYAVSAPAYDCGYGTAEEIVRFKNATPNASLSQHKIL